VRRTNDGKNMDVGDGVVLDDSCNLVMMIGDGVGIGSGGGNALMTVMTAIVASVTVGLALDW